ncbi:MAG: hypothetical protein BYD32DRAFT_259688 [Podila humilis]|nr:MAG: hypothetical protein BYD32DRAFT_259688 [Podila humilis]
MTYVDAFAASGCSFGLRMCTAVGCSSDMGACATMGCSFDLKACVTTGCSSGLEICATDSFVDLGSCAAVGASVGLDTASGLVMSDAFDIAGLAAFSLRMFASLSAAAGLDILAQRPKRSLQRDLSIACELEW